MWVNSNRVILKDLTRRNGLWQDDKHNRWFSGELYDILGIGNRCETEYKVGGLAVIRSIYDSKDAIFVKFLLILNFSGWRNKNASREVNSCYP